MIRLRGVRLEAGDRNAGAPLLDITDLSISSGEYVVLVGRNGAGKSLLLSVLASLRKPTAGEIIFDQTNQTESPVGLLFQSPDDQIVGSTVERDVAFGPENLGVASAEIRARVDDAIREARLAGFERRAPHLMSEGEKQRLALAGVLVLRPTLLLLDEPTARLDPRNRDALLDWIRRVRDERGVTLIHVTHRSEELSEATRAIGLRQGRVEFDGSPEELLDSEAADSFGIRWSQLHRLRRLLRAQGVELPDARGSEGDVEATKALAASPGRVASTGSREVASSTDASPAALVRLRGVGWSADDGTGSPRAILSDIELEIRPGERLGITGPSGAGKTTLCSLLAGLLDPVAGTIEWTDSKSERRAAPRAALAFQEPERGFFEATVLEDVAFGPRNLGASESVARDRAREALRTAGLDPDKFGQRVPETLSGGEARRAGIASVLSLGSRLVLLDEPGTGLDADGLDRLRAILADLHAQGVAFAVVSHDLPFLLEECDRLVVMDAGRIVADVDASAAAVRETALASLGWQSELAPVIDALRATGKLSGDVAPTAEALLAALAPPFRGGE